MKEMYTEISLSHDRGPSRDTGKATIVARGAQINSNKGVEKMSK